MARTEVARWAGAPSNPGSRRARTAVRAEPGGGREQGERGDAEQVGAEAEHPAVSACAAAASTCASSAIRSSLAAAT